MWKCWRNYGKQHIKPKMIGEHIVVLRPQQHEIAPAKGLDYIWVFIPFVYLLPDLGLTLMESSHRHRKNGPDKPVDPIVVPGQALMWHAQLKTKRPTAGGAVMLARLYDVTGL